MVFSPVPEGSEMHIAHLSCRHLDITVLIFGHFLADADDTDISETQEPGAWSFEPDKKCADIL